MTEVGVPVMHYDILRQKKYFILDMDGTFYLGDAILPGALDFINHLPMVGKDFLFFTNNSSKNSLVYVNKLATMNCSVVEQKVLTSGMVTIDYIQRTYHHPKVYLLGTPMLVDDFTRRGVQLVDDHPDIVVAGFDTTITYEKLTKACTFIRNGAPFIATHPDFNCPTEDGFIPDCGAICAFITASTGVKPKYLGKPYGETVEYIMHALGCGKEDIAFVGDRLYTDIAIGRNSGITSILVLTGETSIKDMDTSSVQPDFVFERLGDLVPYL